MWYQDKRNRDSNYLGCDYCSERFHPRSEVERHEENCV